MKWILNVVNFLYKVFYSQEKIDLKQKGRVLSTLTVDFDNELAEQRDIIKYALQKRDEMIKFGFDGDPEKVQGWRETLFKANRQIVDWYIPSQYKETVLKALSLNHSPQLQRRIRLEKKSGLMTTDNDLAERYLYED